MGEDEWMVGGKWREERTGEERRTRTSWKRNEGTRNGGRFGGTQDFPDPPDLQIPEKSLHSHSKHMCDGYQTENKKTMSQTKHNFFFFGIEPDKKKMGG